MLAQQVQDSSTIHQCLVKEVHVRTGGFRDLVTDRIWSTWIQEVIIKEKLENSMESIPRKRSNPTIVFIHLGEVNHSKKQNRESQKEIVSLDITKYTNYISKIQLN